jgi:hypothetical protein
LLVRHFYRKRHYNFVLLRYKGVVRLENSSDQQPASNKAQLGHLQLIVHLLLAPPLNAQHLVNLKPHQIVVHEQGRHVRPNCNSPLENGFEKYANVQKASRENILVAI